MLFARHGEPERTLSTDQKSSVNTTRSQGSHECHNRDLRFNKMGIWSTGRISEVKMIRPVVSSGRHLQPLHPQHLHYFWGKYQNRPKWTKKYKKCHPSSGSSPNKNPFDDMTLNRVQIFLGHFVIVWNYLKVAALTEEEMRRRVEVRLLSFINNLHNQSNSKSQKHFRNLKDFCNES